jgi:hypothetical protein
VALAVCLLFDRRSERAVRALWDRVEVQGVPSLRSHTHGRHVPHVSYAVLRRWDHAVVDDALAGLDGGDPVDLSFDGIGLFRRGRTWLVAGVSADFVAQALPAGSLAAALLAGAAGDAVSAAAGGGGGDGRAAAARTAGPRRIDQQRDGRGLPAGGATLTELEPDGLTATPMTALT